MRVPGKKVAAERRSEKTERRGAVLVECAILLPIIFMLIFGMVELGRMMMVEQLLTNCAREGARQAVLPGVTEADVHEVIDTYMTQVALSGHSRSVTPAPESAAAGTSINVTVSIPYSVVSWLPLGTVKWLNDKTLSSSVEMRKEDS